MYRELLKEWDFKKNINVDPFKIRPGSSTKVWWICPKGHEYNAQIYHRSNGSNCPICYRENQTSFPEQIVFYYLKQIFRNSESRYKIDTVEVDVYVPELKLAIEYDGMYFHRGIKNANKENKKQEYLHKKGITLFRIKEDECENQIKNNIIFYKYSNHHTYLKNALEFLEHLINQKYNISIKFDVDLNRDRTKILESYMQNEKENSIVIKYPDIAKEWNYEKNGKLKPEYFKYSSNKKVWWKCSKGHEWQMSPNSRVYGQKCPFCSSRKVLKGFNDFGSLYPEIAKEWYPNKNGNLTPYDVMPKSTKKVWWLGEKCKHEWQTTVAIRTTDKSGCPYCASNQKRLQKKIV